MAEQKEGYVALSIEQENTTANTSIPAEKTVPSPSQNDDTANFSVESEHPQKNDEPEVGAVVICLGYSVIVIIAIITVIAIPVFVLVIAPIIAIVLLPLLLGLYFIAHIIQVFRSDDYNKVGKFMGALAKWLCICFVLISIDLLLCMLIFGVTPSLKHRKVHDELSITRLIGVLAIICVFLTYSMVTRYLLGYRRLKKEHSEENTHLFEGVIGAINSLFYLLALFSVTRVAPILKEHTILGLSTQKWIRMVILVVLGHHAIGIFTSSIAATLRNENIINASKDGLIKVQGFSKWLARLVEMITGQATSTEEYIRYVVYYAEGLRRSFNFLLTSLLVLLTWILYFGSRLNRSSSHTIRVVYDIGLWTLACILASAFLWLIKSGIILSWKARLVYDKLYKQVSGAADQLYLIGIIAGPKFDILGVWDQKEGGGNDDEHHTEGDQKEAEEGATRNDQIDPPAANRQGSDGNISAGKQKAKLNDRAKTRAREILVVDTKEDQKEGNKEGLQGATSKDQSDQPADRQRSDGATGELGKRKANNISAGKQKAKLDGRAKSRDRNEKKGILHTSRIMRMARYFMDAEKPLSRDCYLSEFVEDFSENNPQPIKKKEILGLHGGAIEEVDYKLIEKQLMKEGECKLADFDKWIRKNHKVCLELGRTLSGAMEVVDCLNNVMVIILVTAVTIVWLLITGIATTKVLVLIASPILTASFIFGESARTLFQGLMFTYVVHPFDVGDLCTIRNVQVEVKRIGVWKTIFSKVGTTDDVVYPNTILAKTSVVNHNRKLDPNDHVELRLSSTTNMKQIKELTSKIEEYMADDEIRFNKHPDGVLVKDIGKTIGISVYFKHDEKSIDAMILTDALQKKTKRRNEFLLQMKTFLEDLKIGESREPQFSGSKSVGH